MSAYEGRSERQVHAFDMTRYVAGGYLERARATVAKD